MAQQLVILRPAETAEIKVLGIDRDARGRFCVQCLPERGGEVAIPRAVSVRLIKDQYGLRQRLWKGGRCQGQPCNRYGENAAKQAGRKCPVSPRAANQCRDPSFAGTNGRCAIVPSLRRPAGKIVPSL